MRIGPYTLPVPVALAPMAGVTDAPFRHACSRFGVGLTFGEMQASDPKLRATRKSQFRLAHRSEPLPRAVQLVGNDPQEMADAACFNVEQGAGMIDLNMGCPAKKVCRKAAGSALLSDPQLVQAIIETVVKAVEVPVTLKIRTGIDIENRNGVEIAMIAEAAGIQALTVHGRTRACKFGGNAEYETIRSIKSKVSIPVIANGDIDSLAKAIEVLNKTGADAIMIGRAALGQPWLPGLIGESLAKKIGGEGNHALAVSKQISEPSLQAQKEVVREHLEGLYQLYGPTTGIRIARKHVKWYFERFPNSRDWIKANNKLKETQQCLDLVNAFYNLHMASEGLKQSGIDRIAA